MHRFFALSAVVFATGCPNRAPPNDPAIEYNTRCAQALERGALDDAEALCDHSLEFCDYYWDAQTNKGLIRKLRGDREGAKGWFIKALRNFQDQAQAANNLGILYLEENRLAEAEGVLRQALKTNPDYAEARFNFALLKLKQNKPAEAEKAYRQLIISAPNVTDGHLGLARSLVLQKKMNDALPVAEHAVLMEPGRAEAWLVLAVIRIELAHHGEAKEALSRCLDEAPSQPECRQLMRELQ